MKPVTSNVNYKDNIKVKSHKFIKQVSKTKIEPKLKESNVLENVPSDKIVSCLADFSKEGFEPNKVDFSQHISKISKHVKKQNYFEDKIKVTSPKLRAKISDNIDSNQKSLPSLESYDNHNKINFESGKDIVNFTTSDVLQTLGEELLEEGTFKTGEVITKATVEGGISISKTGVSIGNLSVIKPLFEVGASELIKNSLKSSAAKLFKEVASSSIKSTSQASRLIPVIGSSFGFGITIYDAIDAYEKTIDPNVSALSVGLAWTTVGLDVISTVAIATGVGAPIGWAATGLSIVTSVASDLTQ